jgi:hypothetical protein
VKKAVGKNSKLFQSKIFINGDKVVGVENYFFQFGRSSRSFID